MIYPLRTHSGPRNTHIVRPVKDQVIRIGIKKCIRKENSEINIHKYVNWESLQNLLIIEFMLSPFLLTYTHERVVPYLLSHSYSLLQFQV